MNCNRRLVSIDGVGTRVLCLLVTRVTAGQLMCIDVIGQYLMNEFVISRRGSIFMRRTATGHDILFVW